MEHNSLFNPQIGVPEVLDPMIRRIVAPNPSPMTFRGTNTYLLGQRKIAVIDPGPDRPEHLEAIFDALRSGQQISHIIVTHAHLDHSELAPKLSAECGAPVFALGPAHVGRSAVMQDLANRGMTGGGEGIDDAFAPDVVVADGDQIVGDDWILDVLHTPGHIGNHICLGYHKQCFTADHVMGWSTSLVSPPDGDLTDFMASCDRLNALTWDRFLPGHGDVIARPHERLDGLIAHRRKREAAILEALPKMGATVGEIAQNVYLDIPSAMMPAAKRNVFAHLIDLVSKGSVGVSDELGTDTVFLRIPEG